MAGVSVRVACGHFKLLRNLGVRVRVACGHPELLTQLATGGVA